MCLQAFQAGKGSQIVALYVPSSAEGPAIYLPRNRLALQLLWVCQGQLHCIASHRIALHCIASPRACWVMSDTSGCSHISDHERHHWCMACIVLTQTTCNITLFSTQAKIDNAMQWWIHDSALAPFGSGLFQVAFSLAVVVYQGRCLSLALQAAISAMVTACVQKQIDSCQSESMALPSATPIFGQATSPQGAA